MAGFVDATCGGCGHRVRVPSSLAGGKVKCPQCATVIDVPSAVNAAEELVTDDMLPEVGNDPIPPPESEEAVPPPKPKGRKTTRRIPVKRPSSHRYPAVGRGGTTTRRIPPVPPKKTNPLPIIIGLACAVVVIIVLVAIRLSGSSGNGTPGGGSESRESQRTSDPEIRKVLDRSRAFLRALRSGNIQVIEKFYDTAEREPAVIRTRITGLLEAKTEFLEARYEPPKRRGDKATVVFRCTYVTHRGGAVSRTENQKVTLRWRKSGGEWLLAEGPSL